jgi:thioredoxin 1
MSELKTKDYVVLLIVVLLVAVILVALLIKVQLDRSAATAQTTAPATVTTVAADSAVVQLVLENGSIVHKPVEDFHAFLAAADRPVFVDFWAAWCGPCISAAPFIESLAEEFDGKAYILKVDIDRADQLVQEYGISSIPAFYVIKDGKTQDSFAGYADSIQGKIREMLEKQIG